MDGEPFARGGGKDLEGIGCCPLEAVETFLSQHIRASPGRGAPERGAEKVRGRYVPDLPGRAIAVNDAEVLIEGKESEGRVLEGNVRDLAKDAMSDTTNAPLDGFLADAVSRAGKIAQIQLTADFAKVSPALTALQAKVAGIRCADCRNGTICDGGDQDDAIVAAGGECISDIKQAFQTGMIETRREYGQLPKVAVSLHTAGRNVPPGLVPGLELAINGRTSYADTPSAKASLVTLEVASAHIDHLSVAALPYVALHEVFCHAYQMAAGSGPRVIPVAFVDPLSEGMMDAVVVELLKDRAEAKREVTTEAGAEADAASRIHLARKSLQERKSFPQAPQVHAGAEAFAAIRSLYAQDSDAATALCDAKRLACDLNLNGWSIEDRLRGFARLRLGLEKRPRDYTLLDLLIWYLNTSDSVQPIIDHLSR